MLVKKAEAKKIDNSPDCTIWEYALPTQDFSYATASITGRYPEQGRVVNLECAELYFVLSGSGIVHSTKGDFEIGVGDVYYFEKGEVFWVEGANLSLALVNAPSWTSEQHRRVD
jgi:mannose-6-phosphate isomerase-like protein (cupin superfamily)